MISTHFSCILSDEVMYVKFCQRLRELREERKLTQTALGAEIHISARMISFYESGNHFPKDEEALKRMAAFFQVSLDYLMGFSDLREEEPVRKLCAALRELPPRRTQKLDRLPGLSVLPVRAAEKTTGLNKTSRSTVFSRRSGNIFGPPAIPGAGRLCGTRCAHGSPSLTTATPL